MSGARCFSQFVVLASFVAGWTVPLVADDEPAFGPLYQEFKLTLNPGERVEGAGPFYYREVERADPDNVTRTWAVPPLFSYVRNDDVDYEQFDFLWKLLTYDRFGAEYRFQLIQWFSFAGGGTQSDTNVSRFTLFPIYFQQRSGIPEKNYTAVFPIYGTIKQRFFREEIHFAMFPLYGRTLRKGVTTDNFVWPVFHLRHGNGVTGWQFWPLMGEERRAANVWTNRWGDPELAGGFYRFFALWPLFWMNEYDLGTANETRQQAVIPFYNYMRSPQRDSTAWGWPLGVTHTIDREKKYKEWGAPWPLIVFARGEGKTMNRVFPFFSDGHSQFLTGRWYAWPIYKYNRLQNAPLDRERTRILFFLYSDTRSRNIWTGEYKRAIDCWPFFSKRHELDGRERFQVLAPIEPYLPNNPGVERNLSPLWSLWRAEKNPKTGAASQSLLWNLYRRDSTPQTKKCSLLFGLFQYQSAPEGKRWRVFYIPFGRAAKPGEPAKP